MNALGDSLREQRLGAMEASALLRTVMAEVDVAIFAFDTSERLRLVNRAGERLIAQHAEHGQAARDRDAEDHWRRRPDNRQDSSAVIVAGLDRFCRCVRFDHEDLRDVSTNRNLAAVDMIVLFVIAVLICVLASILGIWRALKVDPGTALSGG
jgi:hypothetical protein